MDRKTFLEQIVFGWIKNDLERMTKKIPSKSNEVGNINFPLALCTLAYMEYLGGFLLGEDRGFGVNAKEYINNCFEKSTEYPIELLKDIFRNGLAHEYFARGGICRDNLRPAVFKDKTFGPVLDIEILVNDFLNSFDKFKEVLNEEKYKKRMDQAYESIQEWNEEYQILINALPERPITTQQQNYSTTSRPPDYSYSNCDFDIKNQAK